ncbi:MAG: class I SAM-dependent methyltransferase [Myxococcota bacterium]
MSGAGKTPAGPSACPACDGRRFKSLFEKHGRQFWRCRGCGLEQQHPLPEPAELQRYYEDAYVSGMYKPFVDAQGLKSHTAEHRFKSIRSFCRFGRWLDVGTSSGAFVAYARSQGVDAEGIDFARAAVDDARARGTPVSRARIEEFEPGYRFDTVTAFDVLEHVLDPPRFLAGVRRLLRPGGTFAIAVPNQASLYRRLMGRHWFYYIPEEHMYTYNARCLRRLLERAGLEMSHSSAELKPLNLNYALVWLEERNPRIHKLLAPLSALVGERLGDRSLALPLGDLLVLGSRPD